jgi:hypothetical protein
VPPSTPSYTPTAPAFASAGSFPLTATITTPGAATLSWNVVPGAVSYTIYQGINGAPLQFASTTTQTTATVPLGPGAYTFQVHALASGGSEVGVSNVATPAPGPPPGFQPAGLPGGPGAASPANSSVLANPQVASMVYGTQITVIVLDSNRSPVVGHTVYLTSSRGSDAITPAFGTTPVTDNNGRVVFQVRPASPGQAVFTANVDGVPLSSAPVTFQ